jgi:hypothetical protein
VRIVALGGALVFALGASSATPARTASDCTRTSTGLTPLTELGTTRYRGFEGGLYAGGRNAPPAAYLRQGLAAARSVRGRVVLLSIGMSNTTQEFRAFAELARRDASVAPNLRLVDGAQGGQDASRTADARAPYWGEVDRRLRAAGASPQDVQVVWLKQAVARPGEQFPADARRLQSYLRAIVANLDRRFPNLRLVYVSSRAYAGYATTPLNPEPHAYQSAFAVKWLVADRISRRIRGPWVGWGPYLWADGERPRPRGLSWACADFADDGTHPSATGRVKVARELLRFLKTSPTSRGWFVR